MQPICNLWRFGLSEAALMKNYFRFFGIPAPDNSQFIDHSGQFSQSQGGLVFHGAANVTLRWSTLKPTQLRSIRAFIDGSLSGTGFLYLTVPYNNGIKRGITWIDVVGVPHPISPETGGTFSGGALGMYYENVQLFLNSVEIVNDPAVF